jgi:hypothetical protein
MTTRSFNQKFLATGLLLVGFSFGRECLGQISVTTQHNDIGRTGQNASETILTPANVNATSFGKLFTQIVDGVMYAQPLYMQNVTVPTKGTHNVVFAATENDTVYAFDADNNGGVNGVPLWEASLKTPAHGALPGATSVPSIEIGEDIAPVIGITGTPVIDPVAGLLYVVSFTEENSNYVLRLHALKIASGDEERGSPVVIQASISGTGNGSSGGILAFDPKWENQRPGLLLLDGVVYIGFAAHGDAGPWHGWLFAYNSTTLKQISVYCASPNGVGGGFWMSGAGIAADTDDAAAYPLGRLFPVTGNGDFSATASAQATADYGDSVLKLSLQDSVLTLGDSFTPSDQAYLDASDGDLAAGGALVIPDADSTTHLLVQSGKEGKIYLLNRENLGSYHATDAVVQELANGTTSTTWGAGLWGLPAYWNKTLYFPGRNAPLQAFTLSNGLLSTSPTSSTTEVFNYPAPTPSISANGTTNGIVWLLEYTNADAPGGVLEAYNENLSSLLYSSQTNAVRDGLTTGVRFAVPTVANGKVYAASQSTDLTTNAVSGQLNVFGLLSGLTTAAAPTFSPASESFATAVSVTITDATPGAAIYYTTDGSTPSAISTRYTGPIAVSRNATITAIASVARSLQSPPAAATYTSTTEVPDPGVNPKTGIYTNSVPVTITESKTGTSIYYTTDGSTPTASSTLYKGPFTLTVPDTAIVKFNVIALDSGFSASNVITRSYEIDVEGTSVNFGSGFSSATGVMTFNGSTDLDDTRLQLTSGAENQAGSAFYNTPLEISAFTTEFSFQLSNPVAEGITFTLQGVSPVALGSSGAGLGYAGIESSMALIFDFTNTDSTGVFVDGVTPNIPAVSLAGAGGINLTSDDTIDAQLVYTGNTLDVTLTDLVTEAVWATSFNVDIQALTGGVTTTAYAGFTGSTSATGSSSQKILTWTYLAGTPTTTATAAPTFSLKAGTYAGAQTVSLRDTTSAAKIYYTTDGSQPSTTSKVYGGPITVSSTETITAIAQAPSDLMSPVSTIKYTIGN